jgi:hypothetical protein
MKAEMISTDGRLATSAVRYPRNIVTRQLVLVCATLMSLSFSAHAQESHSERILVQGVGASRSSATDPSAADNISEYSHNFSHIISLSYMDDVNPSHSGPMEFTADLINAAANLNGVLTPKVRGELLDVRNHQVDEIMAHSWGAAAVEAGLLDGSIRLPPRKLVIVSPPNLSPQGAAKWKELASRFPDMKIEIYINPDDILESVRDGVLVAEKHLEKGGLAPADESPNVTQDLMAYFISRNVTVRTYHAKGISPLDPIAAHRLKYFLEFASQTRLDGITRHPPPPPITYATSSYESYNTADFLLDVSQESLKSVEIQQQVSLHEQALRGDNGGQVKEAQAEKEALWQYFVSLLEMSCQGPASIDRIQHSAYSVLFSSTVIRDFAAKNNLKLSECAQDLLSAVLRSDAPVDFTWIRREAARYTRRQRKLEREREAERRRTEAEYERETARTTSTAKESRQSNGRGSPSQSNPNIDHLGYKQAQGISAGAAGIFDGR